jgi:hypothetical protein
MLIESNAMNLYNKVSIYILGIKVGVRRMDSLFSERHFVFTRFIKVFFFNVFNLVFKL